MNELLLASMHRRYLAQHYIYGGSAEFIHSMYQNVYTYIVQRYAAEATFQ